MGRVIIREEDRQWEAQHTGPWIDFIQEHWPLPLGFGGMSNQTKVNGELWLCENGDFDRLIGDDDTVEFCITPSGIEVIVLAVVAVAAVSTLATLLLRPKVDELGSAVSSAYGVDARANRAALGDIIPVKYGQVFDTPHYVSQSYRYFEDHREIRVFLLSASGGDVDVDEILIGDVTAAELPSSTIRSEVYKPQDHNSAAGHIETDFGIRENVNTSGAVENQELRDAIVASDKNNKGTTTAGSSVITFDDDVASAAISGGDTLLITSPASLVGTYDVATSDNTSITIAGTFGATINDEDVDFQVLAPDDGFIGYFNACAAGEVITGFEVDIEMPRGQQRVEGKNLALRVQVDYEEIDGLGNVIAGTAGTTYFNETAATRRHRRYSFSVSNLPLARYRVRCRAQTRKNFNGIFGISFGADADAEDGDLRQVNWTGLKGFIPVSGELYGNQTIAAIELTGSEAIAGQDRIFLRTQSLLKNISTGVVERTSNPADIVADIMTNVNYGLGRPETELEMATLLELRTKALPTEGANGVFDRQVSGFTAIQQVVTPFQCQPYRRRAPLGVVFDDIKPMRTAVVSPSNRIGTGVKTQLSWINTNEPDGIEVRYRSAVNFEEVTELWPPAANDVRRIAAPDDFDPAPIIPESIEARFITNRAHAIIHAQYLWNLRRYRTTEQTVTVELEGLNWDVFDRVGSIVPNFDWGDGSSPVLIHDGVSVTLRDKVEAGPVVVSFKGVDGVPTDPVGAIADGSNVIILDSAPLTSLTLDDCSFENIAFIEREETQMKDFVILSLSSDGETVDAELALYSDIIPTLQNYEGVRASLPDVEPEGSAVVVLPPAPPPTVDPGTGLPSDLRLPAGGVFP